MFTGAWPGDYRQLVSDVLLVRVSLCPCAVVQLPMPVAAAIGGSPENAPHGAVMMWPLCPIRKGEKLTRDFVPGQRSLQRAAMLLTLLESPRHATITA